MKNVQHILKKICSVKELLIGITILIILILVAILSPFIATNDPYFLNDDLTARPSAKYIFGTDGLGRMYLAW